ncbi:MAG: Flp pilus assembly protein CpaB [Micavibrio sp.]|nr:Flp pilus assembly protein CpaB [Micavibrio sp.]
MNKNLVIVLIGAVLVSVLVAVLVQVTLGGKQEPQVVQEARVQILVANKDLGVGHTLKEGDMRWQEWPKAGVFLGAVIREDDQSPEEALEGRLARTVMKGEPVMKTALLGQAQGNLVAASLETGQRAVAFPVNAASMAGGFIGPGDYVDIILTYSERVTAEGDDDPEVRKMLELTLDRYATETILQNVKVLAVDQKAERGVDDKNNGVKVGKTVTVAVNSEDAERLAVAEKLGDLRLSLRGVGDETIVEKKWPTVSDARLTTMGDEIFEKYEKIKDDTGLNNNIVRIYDGGSVSALPAQ